MTREEATREILRDVAVRLAAFQFLCWLLPPSDCLKGLGADIGLVTKWETLERLAAECLSGVERFLGFSARAFLAGEPQPPEIRLI